MPHCQHCGQHTGFVTYCPSHYFHEELCLNAKKLIAQRNKQLPVVPVETEKQGSKEIKELKDKITQVEKRVDKLEVSVEVLENSVKRITKTLGQISSILEVSLLLQLSYLSGNPGTPTIRYLESLGSWHIRNYDQTNDLFDKIQAYHGNRLDTYSSNKDKKNQSCIFLQDVIRVMLRKTTNSDVKDALIDMLFEIETSRIS